MLIASLLGIRINTCRMNKRAAYSRFTMRGQPCVADPAGMGGVELRNHYSGLQYWFWLRRGDKQRRGFYFPIWWKTRLVFSWSV